YGTRRITEDFIGCHESVDFAICAKTRQLEYELMEGNLLRFPSHDLFVDQCSGRQACARLVQAFTGGACDRPLNAQAEFINVERLGDVIVRAKLKPPYFAGTGIFLGEEDDRNITGDRGA